MSICSKCGCPGNIGSTNPEMEITRLTRELAEANKTTENALSSLVMAEADASNLRAKLEAVEQRANDSYKQGVEDAHRCEKRHATIDKLEAENAALREENKDRSWQITKLREEVEKLKMLADFDTKNAVRVIPNKAAEKKILQLEADLAASQKEVARLNGSADWHSENHSRIGLEYQQLLSKYHDSELSRGRLIEALEKMGCSCCDGYMPHDQDFENCSKNLAEKLIKSEPRSDVYEAMKGAREALQTVGQIVELNLNNYTDEDVRQLQAEVMEAYHISKEALSSLTAVLGMSEGEK